MAKAGSKDLFFLIRSLSGAEKGYFKKYAERYEKGDKHYTRLFEMIDGQASYDEKTIGSVLRREGIAHRLPAIKNYLYFLILRSLQSFGANRSLKRDLETQLGFAQTLMQRSLYRQSKKILQRCRPLAYKYGLYEVLAEICMKEVNVMHDEMEPLDRKRLEKIFAEYGQALETLKEQARYYKLSSQMDILYHYHGSYMARSKTDLAGAQEIISSPALRSPEPLHSFNAKRYYYHIYGTYYFLRGDYRKSLGWRLQSLRLTGSNPDYLRDYPRNYIALINNLAGLYLMLKDYDRLAECIRKMRAVPVHTAADQSMVFSTSSSLEMDYYIQTGRFEEGSGCAALIGQKMETGSGKLGYSGRVDLYYLLGYLCFGGGRYAEALKWIRRILDESPFAARSDIQCFARILHLIIHYEMNHAELMEYIVKSTYRFLLKRNRYFKMEGAILNFIRKKLPAAGSRQKAISAFMDFEREIIKLSRDNFERKALYYFDIISWLESKISSRPFAEIVREKVHRTNL